MVIIVVVNTPFIMGPCENITKDLCTDEICCGVNITSSILSLLYHINSNGKMVIFVPAKCEKWAKENGGLTCVKQRIEQVYSESIDLLKKNDRINISIIPVQTAGNIIFSEFRPAYEYKKSGHIVRCSKISDDIIRNVDGENEFISDDVVLYQSPNAIIRDTKLFKPYSWYMVNPKDSSFKPDAEQLTLHIIRFMLKKMIDSERINKKKFWSHNSSEIGDDEIEGIKSLLAEIESDNVINNSGNGIEVIRNDI